MQYPLTRVKRAFDLRRLCSKLIHKSSPLSSLFQKYFQEDSPRELKIYHFFGVDRNLRLQLSEIEASRFLKDVETSQFANIYCLLLPIISHQLHFHQFVIQFCGLHKRFFSSRSLCYLGCGFIFRDGTNAKMIYDHAEDVQ